MTIALIGRENAIRAQARVALVSKQDLAGMADAIVRGGNDAVACESWDEFTAESGEHAFDLVLCDEASADDMPSDIQTPVIRVHDESDVSEQLMEPLFALAMQLSSQVAQVKELESVVEGIRTGSALVGKTPALRRLQSAIARAADCDATVLVEGAAGSGKSLAARSIHLKSRRCTESLVVHECASLTADGLQSAIKDCAETTLVLESVDQLPAAAQQVLVKHLKERSTRRAPSMVRLIATTSAHIPELVARGTFREDLFYRLHAFPVVVPSLAERADDVLAIADAILDAGVPVSGRNHQGFTPAARMLLESMQWPGNVAQLEATVRRGQVLAGGAPIDREHLMAPGQAGAQQMAPALASSNAPAEELELTEDSIRPFEEEEKLLLGRALQATKGNVRRAAQLLGIGRATLYRKIQQYHLRLH